jgi:hypothetical protein
MQQTAGSCPLWEAAHGTTCSRSLVAELDGRQSGAAEVMADDPRDMGRQARICVLP